MIYYNSRPYECPIKARRAAAAALRGKRNQWERNIGIKGKDMLGFEPKESIGISTWLDSSDINKHLTPSAKTTVLKGILLKYLEEAPLDKVSRAVAS